MWFHVGFYWGAKGPHLPWLRSAPPLNREMEMGEARRTTGGAKKSMGQKGTRGHFFFLVLVLTGLVGG